ncbi:MAG: hypothetical protein BGO49_11125 [Planctomycetales bacterium 71-10]|nr:MAG: hypothetical protein BGO49_11125 [Planctomycetales bacterium 71-10]
MPVGDLVVRCRGDFAPLNRSLVASSKALDSWAGSVSTAVDSAFSRLAKDAKAAPMKALTGSIQKLDKVKSVARTALAFGDVGRAAGWAAVGAGRLRLAFMSSGEKADALRSKLDKAGSALKAVGAVSRKARFGLMLADLTLFGAKLGALAGGAVGRLAKEMLGVFVGGVRMGFGLVRATVSLVGMGSAAVKAVKALGFSAVEFGKAGLAASRFVLTLGRSTAALGDFAKASIRGVVGLWSAIQYGAYALSWIPGIVGGLKSVVGGAMGAARSLVGVGKSLLAIGWNVATSAASAFRATLGGIVSTAGSVAGALAKIGPLAGVVGVALGVKAAGMAAHLNETISKTEQVFGKSADGVVAQAERMNVAFGTARKEYLDGASALGGQLQGVGYAEKDAAALSMQLTNLAADAAAFRDVGFDESLRKIQAGLSGEAEPLKAWGILIDESTVKLQAQKMGLVKAGEEMGNAAKYQARLAIITQGLAKDSGALAREAKSPANQMAEFWGRLQTLGETVGASFAPAFGSALEVVNQGIATLTANWGAISEAVGGFISGVGSTLLSWAGSVADFFELGGGKIDYWRLALGTLADGWQVMGVAFQAVKTAVLGGMTAIFKGLSYIAQGFDWVYQKVTGKASDTASYLSRIGDKLGEASKGSAQQLADAWAKPWAHATDAPDKLGDALIGVKDKVLGAYDAAGAQIARMREEMSKPLAASVSAPVSEDPAKKDKKAKKQDPFAGAMKLGSAEAASVLLKSRFGSGKDAVAESSKQTAENTKVQIDVLGRIESALKAAVAPSPTYAM